MERKGIGNEKERTCNNKRGLHASVREIGRVRPETSVQPAQTTANSLISSGSGR